MHRSVCTLSICSSISTVVGLVLRWTSLRFSLVLTGHFLSSQLLSKIL